MKFIIIYLTNFRKYQQRLIEIQSIWSTKLEDLREITNMHEKKQYFVN